MNRSSLSFVSFVLLVRLYIMSAALMVVYCIFACLSAIVSAALMIALSAVFMSAAIICQSVL